MNYRNFIRIIVEHGFAKVRQGATSHAIYRGTIDGETRQVVVPGTGNTDIPRQTFASMVRQSGLPRKLFR